MLAKRMWPGAIIALSGGVASAQGPVEILPAPDGETTVSVGAVPGFVPVWQGPADDGPMARPGHPPIDEIPPMPMPARNANPPGMNGPMGQPVVFDAETGEEFFLPIYPAAANAADRAPGYEGPYASFDFPELAGTESFGTLTLVADPGADPFARSVKLVMRFVDAGGVNRFFVCSGGMQDAEVVLTAGHCIYAFNPNGFNINDWAEEVWVYPGWDGDGNTADDSAIIQNFGYAKSNSFMSFTGWTSDQNNDWDMGVIGLGRAVGMLTSWYGWGFGGSCGTIQGKTHYLYTYPAESCSPTLHNGRDMYRWAGTYDGCPGNQLEIDTTPGCFTEQHGGMSGGNSYWIEDGNRYARAVVSNSLINGEAAWHTEMWDSFRDSMVDFENARRGSSLDIQALDARSLTTVVIAGNAVADFQCRFPNPTNNNPGSQTYPVRVYLSSNSTISTGDTLLRDTSYTWDYAAMQNLNVTFGNVTIPKNTPSGTFWVGGYLNYSDASTGNNDSSGWDAHQITVLGVADVSPSSVTSSGSAITGQSVTVNHTIQNLGGDPSNTVNVDYYLSTNNIISTGDTFLESRSFGGIAGNGSSSASNTVTIPAGLTPGTYYLGIIADSSDDTDSGNNARASSNAINIDGRSDLVAGTVSPPSGSYPQGATIGVGYTVLNTGNDASGTYTVDFYASTNTTITTVDRHLGSRVWSSLGAGGTRTSTANVLIPGDLAPGNYYIGTIVSQGFNEIDLSDNNQSSRGTITVFGDCPADLTGSSDPNDPSYGQPNGVADSEDFFFFLDGFTAGQLGICDMTGSSDPNDPSYGNRDGVCDGDDFFYYLDLFVAGCP